MSNLYKYDSIMAMSAVAKASKNKLIVTTSSGQYFGELLDKESIKNYPIADTHSKGLEKYRLSIPDESQPQAIYLGDVTLYNSTHSRFNLPFVVIFIDQITAITVGSLSETSDVRP